MLDLKIRYAEVEKTWMGKKRPFFDYDLRTGHYNQLNLVAYQKKRRFRVFWGRFLGILISKGSRSGNFFEKGSFKLASTEMVKT